MKSAVILVLMSSALLFCPTAFTEQFEQVKVWAFVTFASCSLLIVDWRLLLKDSIASLLALFTFSAALSTILSIDPHMSFYGNWRAPMGLLTICSYLVFYLAARKAHFDSKAIYFVIAASIGISVYAILQAFGIDFMKWNGTLSIGEYTRPPSTLGHPNFTAGYLAMVLPLVIYRAETGKRFERILMCAAVPPMVCTILLCQSRGMWIAAVFGMAVYLIWSGKSKATLISLLVASGLVFSVLLISGPKGFHDSVLNRMQYVFEPGAARHEYPKAAVRIWRTYPFFGAGTDAYEIAFQHQRTAHYWAIEKGGSPHRSHFDLLNILATQGALGFIIALLMIVAAFLRLLISDHPARAAIAACLAAFLIEGLSSFVMLPTGTLAIFCLAIL